MKTLLNTLRAFLASANTACAGYFLYCVKNNPEQEVYYLVLVLIYLVIATRMIMSIKNKE